MESIFTIIIKWIYLFFSQVRNTILLSVVFRAVNQVKVIADTDNANLQQPVEDSDINVKLFLGVLFVLWLTTFALIYGVIKKSYNCIWIFLTTFEAHLFMAFIWIMGLRESTIHSIEKNDEKPPFVEDSVVVLSDFLAYFALKMFYWRLEDERIDEKE